MPIKKQSIHPDEVLAKRAKNIISDICESPENFDMEDIITLWRRHRGDLAQFAKSLIEYQYITSDGHLPYENQEEDHWVGAALYQQWQTANWESAGRAIAPVARKLPGIIEAWEREVAHIQ